MSSSSKSAGEIVLNGVFRVLMTKTKRIRFEFEVDIETALAMLVRILRAAAR